MELAGDPTPAVQTNSKAEIVDASHAAELLLSGGDAFGAFFAGFGRDQLVAGFDSNTRTHDRGDFTDLLQGAGGRDRLRWCC